MKVGKTDAFERKYMAKFRDLVSERGEIVLYEKDRSGRDIGLHFTEKSESGYELVSATMAWFQMKGTMEGTLPKEKAETKSDFSISIEVEHLRHWHVQPIPTYLCLYIESLDSFYVRTYAVVY